jgi:hypothetical protein
LFGAAYRHTSREVNAVTVPNTPTIPGNPASLFPGPNTLISARVSDNQNAFSMLAGGGIDYRFGKRLSLRPVEIDYLLTRFPSLSSVSRQNQSSLMVSTGVVFTFGEK